jgi:hypothetical protein
MLGSASPTIRAGSVAVALVGCRRSISACSTPLVLASDTCVSSPVSSPNAMTATPASTAMPSPRRTHSPAPSERFIAANTRPPISKAMASDVAAPAA